MTQAIDLPVHIFIIATSGSTGTVIIGQWGIDCDIVLTFFQM